VALPKLPKLERGVRFPLPAPARLLRPRFSLTLATLLLSALPAAAGGLVTPDGRQAPPAWTPEQLQAEIARSPVYRDGDLSGFYLRLAGREEPHVHADNALLVVVLEGRGTIHFADREVAMAAGDTVLIPRGVEHWAESTGPEAMVAVAVITPALPAP
jgi:mannose-6-phosphate isomerase-like protein (cupin superfamily)